MDLKTLTALQGSIAKWQAILDGEGFDEGCDNCPLCYEFLTKEAEEPEWAQDGCFGCPVAHHTGLSGCGRTPYQAWASYGWDHRDTGAGVLDDDGSAWHYKVFDDESRKRAQAELDFLRSLMPPSPQSGGEKR